MSGELIKIHMKSVEENTPEDTVSPVPSLKCLAYSNWENKVCQQGRLTSYLKLFFFWLIHFNKQLLHLLYVRHGVKYQEYADP